MNVRRYSNLSSIVYPFDLVKRFLVNVFVKRQQPAVLQLEGTQFAVKSEYVRFGQADGACEDELLGVEDVWTCHIAFVQIGPHCLIHEIGYVLASLLRFGHNLVVESPLQSTYEDSIVSQGNQLTRVILYILIACLLY